MLHLRSLARNAASFSRCSSIYVKLLEWPRSASSIQRQRRLHLRLLGVILERSRHLPGSFRSIPTVSWCSGSVFGSIWSVFEVTEAVGLRTVALARSNCVSALYRAHLRLPFVRCLTHSGLSLPFIQSQWRGLVVSWQMMQILENLQGRLRYSSSVIYQSLAIRDVIYLRNPRLRRTSHPNS